MRCPQGGDFAAPAGKVVLGRFQEEGQIAQGRVVRHSGERIKADAALADGGVAVLVGADGFFESFKWMARKRSSPMTRSNSSSTPSKSPAMS